MCSNAFVDRSKLKLVDVMACVPAVGLLPVTGVLGRIHLAENRDVRHTCLCSFHALASVFFRVMECVLRARTIEK